MDLKKSLFWLCLTSVIIVPFSNDMFISALPLMKVDFNTPHIGWVISVFLLGLATSQLFYGPLSDRFGRKPVLLAGLCVFIVGSGFLLFVDTFSLFLLGRFIQAIGACSVIVSSLAIVRDTTDGKDLVKTIGIVMSIIGICPAVAPLVGSFLTTLWGWKASFILLLLLGLFYFVILGLFFKETHKEKNQKALYLQHMFGHYLTLLMNRRYLLFCLLSGLSYGVLFTYFSLAAIYIVHLFHFSLIAFGWIVLFIGLIIFTTSMLVPHFSVRWGLPKVALYGTLFIFLGGGAMVLANVIIGANIYTLMLPMAVVTIGIGTIRPTASAGAMSQGEKKISGSASAGYNFISFVGGSLCTALGGSMHAKPLYLGLFIVLIGIVAVALAFVNANLKAKSISDSP